MIRRRAAWKFGAKSRHAKKRDGGTSSSTTATVEEGGANGAVANPGELDALLQERLMAAGTSSQGRAQRKPRMSAIHHITMDNFLADGGQ